MNNNQDLIQTEINNFNNIDDLINLKNQIKINIYSFYNKIEESKKQIIILEEKINSLCQHIWTRDYSYYGEHSQYICNICKLYK